MKQIRLSQVIKQFFNNTPRNQVAFRKIDDYFHTNIYITRLISIKKCTVSKNTELLTLTVAGFPHKGFHEEFQTIEVKNPVVLVLKPDYIKISEGTDHTLGNKADLRKWFWLRRDDQIPITRTVIPTDE